MKCENCIHEKRCQILGVELDPWDNQAEKNCRYFDDKAKYEKKTVQETIDNVGSRVCSEICKYLDKYGDNEDNSEIMEKCCSECPLNDLC